MYKYQYLYYNNSNRIEKKINMKISVQQEEMAEKITNEMNLKEQKRSKIKYCLFCFGHGLFSVQF